MAGAYTPAMARRIALLLTLASWNCAQSQIAPALPVTVPAFTRVEVKLGEQISSKTNHTGDRFKLTITNDVYIDDFLAIPAGSEGEGEVVHAAPAGLGGKPGELILAALVDCAKVVACVPSDSTPQERPLRRSARHDDAGSQSVGFFHRGRQYRCAKRYARGSGDRRRRAAAAKRECRHGGVLSLAETCGPRNPLQGPRGRSGAREIVQGYLLRRPGAGGHTPLLGFLRRAGPLTLDVEPGETYYVRGELTQGLLNPHPNLTPSDKTTFESMKPKLTDVTGKHIAGAPEPQTTEQ